MLGQKKVPPYTLSNYTSIGKYEIYMNVIIQMYVESN